MSLLNLVRQSISAVATTGQLDLTLGAAVPGARTMAAAGAVAGRTYSYVIQEGAKWEIGRGSYASAPDRFLRHTVIASSAGGTARETFTTAATIQITALAEDIERLAVVQKGNSGTAAQTFDVSRGKVQIITNTGAHSWTFAGWAPEYDECLVGVVNAGAFPLTFTQTVQWYKGDGTRSSTFSTMGVTLQAAGLNWFHLWTPDGGAQLCGRAI